MTQGFEINTKKKKTDWKKELFQIAVFAFLIFAFKSCFIGNFTVPTGSMEKTILPGDKIIADMRCYNIRLPFTSVILFEVSKPQISDIVVFDYPNDRNINYVKRLVGLPGDILEVHDGFITRNGEKFKTTPDDEEFLAEIVKNGGNYEEESREGVRYMVHRKPQYMRLKSEPRTFRVPEGHYFFMGDNRDRSSDSREWGFVPFDHIKGKAKFIYFSSESDPGWFTIPKRIRYERFFSGLE